MVLYVGRIRRSESGYAVERYAVDKIDLVDGDSLEVLVPVDLRGTPEWTSVTLEGDVLRGCWGFDPVGLFARLSVPENLAKI